jgi:hypothetical protein
MRLFTIIILALIFSLNKAHGQAKTDDDEPKHATFGMCKVFVEPVAFLDLWGGSTIRFGAEVPFSYRWSVIGTYGTYNYYGKGYYLKGGIKRYFTSDKMQDVYLELAGFYKIETHTIGDNLKGYDTTKKQDEPGPSFEYEIHKRVYGATMEIGEIISGRHFVFEWFAGVGFRTRFVTASISPHEQGTLYHYNESMIENFSNGQVQAVTYPSITLGIRLGLAFGRNPVFDYW